MKYFDSDPCFRKKLITDYLRNDLTEFDYSDIEGAIIHLFLTDNGCTVDPISGNYLFSGALAVE